MGSENLHEKDELLSDATKNMHRAIVSLMEELEAVDWYTQRSEACTDDELKAVLVHNRNEEIEHAMMTLEWLRRNSPEFAENIDTYLGAQGPIVGVEAGSEGRTETGDEKLVGGGKGGAAKSGPRDGCLGIGSLKKGKP